MKNCYGLNNSLFVFLKLTPDCVSLQAVMAKESIREMEDRRSGLPVDGRSASMSDALDWMLEIIKANQTVTANMKKHVGMLILFHWLRTDTGSGGFFSACAGTIEIKSLESCAKVLDFSAIVQGHPDKSPGLSGNCAGTFR